jgi:hypothetical protein
VQWINLKDGVVPIVISHCQNHIKLYCVFCSVNVSFPIQFLQSEMETRFGLPYNLKKGLCSCFVSSFVLFCSVLYLDHVALHTVCLVARSE